MMGTGILTSLGLVLKVFAFACFLLIQESNGETTLSLIPNVDVFISPSPTPESQPTNDAGLQPPLNIIPPLASAPPFPLTSPPSPGNSVPSLPPISQPELAPFPSLQPPPEPVTPPSSSPPPSEGSHHPSPSLQPPPEPITPPSSSPPPSEGSHHPSPILQPPPEPVTPPLSSPPPSEGSHHPSVPKSEPPNSHDAPSVAPVSNSPAPRRMPVSSPPEYPDLPKEPPSSPPESSKNHALSPALPRISPSTKPISAEPPSSTPPARHASPMLAPPSSISSKTRNAPVSAPPPLHDSPVDQTPTQAPSTSNRPRPVHPMNAPPPRSLSNKSKHESQSPAPLPHEIPPPSGSFSHASPINSPVSSCVDNCPDAQAPSPASTSNLSPFVSPKKFPSAPRPRPPLPPPLQSLPPPPPQKDCGPLTCSEPLTYGPSESPCICVYPIQVGLRLGVALYTFFPSVSELASEIAAGVFMRPSQVRIMGANAASDNPEKTSVLIYLLPVKTKFDDTTAYFTFERFWHKQVVINSSLFGDYDVLYVKYPGLPPSPPLPPSIIATKPYSGPDNNARTMQPLGIDVSRKHHKHGPNRSILAIIILSSLLAIVVVSALVSVFLSRYRRSKENMDTSPPSTVRSLAKTSVISVTGNGPSSPPVSMSSSLAAYTGSTRTFSLNDMLRATDCFNEARILGEGGFGCVYSGTLEDGTKVAMKILKRNDQQGAREFLAEVEMLGRLHHRNLVKLIGICVEDRTRCLVYELMPNGSLESHLHGVDKETSPLDWSARLKIALGAARALAYLHEDSSPPVIHRDFKASNILLGDDFTPKVSDFGLARNALNERNQHISTHVMGTFGYVAPEYAMTGRLLVKSDVYSYGVVLLELLTGKKPVDMSQPPGLENLVSWARPMLTNHETLRSIIDQSLGPDFPFNSIAKVAAIASMCVQPEVSHRPFMGEVVQALKLIYEETKDSRRSSFSSREDLSSTVVESRNRNNTNQRIENLLTQSPVSDYDYRLEVERDLSMSELLSSSARFGMQDSESLRRHSSSGPIRTSKARHLWKSMRRITGTSLSEHGIMSRLWPGSH